MGNIPPEDVVHKNVNAASYVRGLDWGFWKITQWLLIHTEEKVMERLGLYILIGGKTLRPEKPINVGFQA